MNILELQEKRLNLQSELKSLIDNGEAEKRELNEEEVAKLAELRNSIDEVNSEIEAIEKENRTIEKNNKPKQENRKTMKLVELINGIANGSLTDEQRAFVNGNKIDTRTLAAGVEKSGEEIVPEDKKSLEVAIRNASVLDKLGCTWFKNATGNISIPSYDGSSVAWKGENVTADNGEGATDELTLSPKRLTAYIDISKTLLIQANDDVEGIIVRDLAKAVAEKLDMTVFGKDAGDDTKPAGLFNGVTEESFDDLDYEAVLKMEQTVEEANGYAYKFVVNPAIKFRLRGTQMASGLQMVMDKNEIDGYETIVSNSVAGALCIVPEDLVVAQFGGIEITVDPYTRAINNEVRLIVNANFDAGVKSHNRLAKALYK